MTGSTDPIQAASPPASATGTPAPRPPAEPRQRWRLTFAREPVPADQVGRVALDAWQETLAASGLPVAGLEAGGAGRARIAFGAPLPALARGAAELADIWLLERRPLWALREGLADRMPAGHRWIAAEDVWLGAPALAGRVAAADWRVEVAGAVVAGAVAEAAAAMIAARTLPRVRLKGGAQKRYDLRPLLDGLSVDGPGGPAGSPISILVRTRFHPELGAGRPEEVVAALAEAVGTPLEIASITRDRLVLADDLPQPRRR